MILNKTDEQIQEKVNTFAKKASEALIELATGDDDHVDMPCLTIGTAIAVRTILEVTTKDSHSLRVSMDMFRKILYEDIDKEFDNNTDNN